MNLYYENKMTNHLFQELEEEYDIFVQNYNMHGIGKTMKELHVMLKLHEHTLPKKDDAPALYGLNRSKKLKLRALNLYVGNGHRATVEAIVNFHLCLPSGLVIILNNCHYASSIIRGIILVSCLKDNGSVNYFCDNGISVSKDGLLYFHAIPCDGIYEIDLHFAYSNDSSIYSNQIKKLKHDGLLKSTNHESFDKCVSCMSGKTACKPYSQQVERAMDLLGLIHTDVCGLFRIVSRQGSSYFVTFTDDFSHYGYVYLLKHKHEVFETFKVFQKEVENQLGKTIKASRYDRRGEFISQEFMDHLKEHGIIVYRTPLYTPQHNGVFKRKNTTLLDMKTDMDGNVHTCKARLVAKDFTQTYEVDYKETFSLVADIRAIRILIAIIAYYDYEIWQMDVKTAFRNGHLSKEVYMVQPKGFFDPKLQTNDVDWKSTKQSILATSSTEAEYIAALDASNEEVRIRKFISGIVLFPQMKYL
nr:hypothetical protein [Tanacetum cinerariifolium]